MTLQILYFILGILLPYGVEQYAYSKLIPVDDKREKNEGDFLQEYGWRFIWDTAYFLVLIGAGYRMIFTVPPFSNWEWFGYISFLFGVLLRVWSLKSIGRFYNSGIAIKPDHQMIRTGPYRILRHPLHIGTVLQITGLAFFAPLWLAIPAILASLLLCLYLNYTEDRTHSQKLGSVFEVYYLETWDIVDLIIWKNKMWYII